MLNLVVKMGGAGVRSSWGIGVTFGFPSERFRSRGAREVRLVSRHGREGGILKCSGYRLN